MSSIVNLSLDRPCLSWTCCASPCTYFRYVFIKVGLVAQWLALPSPFNPPPGIRMQRPTLQNTRVRSTRDALQVFYAVARNALPLITRRLDAEERRAIAPGIPLVITCITV